MRLERQVAFWLCGLAVLVALLWVLGGVLLPFAAALALGYVLNPVADRLERLGLPRLGAVLVILVLFLIGFIAVLVLVVPVLAHQFGAFVDSLPGYVS